MNKDKKILLLNITAMFVMIALDIIYLVLKTPYVFKTLASVFFVIMGIINFLIAKKDNFDNHKHKKFAILMLFGLIFAMIGDIVLIDFFVPGAALFAVGHIFFFIAYLQLSQFGIRDLICFVCIIIPSVLLILLYDGFVFNGIMLPVVIVYAIIISLMLGKSISNLFDCNMGKLAKIVIFIGSIMFFLSDVCLLFNVFANWGKWIDVLCLAFYYPAEILLSASIYYSTRKGD